MHFDQLRYADTTDAICALDEGYTESLAAPHSPLSAANDVTFEPSASRLIPESDRIDSTIL